MTEIDFKRSAAATRPSRKTEILWHLGCRGAAAVALPRIFGSGGSLTTFSLIGISIIFSLSYNILLGQTGLLSFGHAVYYGLGGFLVIHAINIISANKLPIPLPFVPLIGGLTGLFFAVTARLGLDPAQRHGVRDDLAWRRRIGRLVRSDPAHASSAAKPASPPIARSCSGCSTGISDRRFRSTI